MPLMEMTITQKCFVERNGRIIEFLSSHFYCNIIKYAIQYILVPAHLSTYSFIYSTTCYGGLFQYRFLWS